MHNVIVTTQEPDQSKCTSRLPGESFQSYQLRLAAASAERAKRRRAREAGLKEQIAAKAFANLIENKVNPAYDRDLAVTSAISTDLFSGRLAKRIKADLICRYPRGFDCPRGKTPGYQSDQELQRRLRDLEAFRQMPPLSVSKANVFGRIGVTPREGGRFEHRVAKAA